jgi:hypothetical protein
LLSSNVDTLNNHKSDNDGGSAEGEHIADVMSRDGLRCTRRQSDRPLRGPPTGLFIFGGSRVLAHWKNSALVFVDIDRVVPECGPQKAAPAADGYSSRRDIFRAGAPCRRRQHRRFLGSIVAHISAEMTVNRREEPFGTFAGEGVASRICNAAAGDRRLSASSQSIRIRKTTMTCGA